MRRDTGETYQEFITNLAKTSGIQTPTAAELAHFDRKRKDKTVSNDEWQIRVVVQDKGYHGAQVLANVEELDIRGYISEPDRGRQRWTARDPQEPEFKRVEQAAVYRNRRRRKRARSKALHRRRGELVERSFESAAADWTMAACGGSG